LPFRDVTILFPYIVDVASANRGIFSGREGIKFSIHMQEREDGTLKYHFLEKTKD